MEPRGAPQSRLGCGPGLRRESGHGGCGKGSEDVPVDTGAAPPPGDSGEDIRARLAGHRPPRRRPLGRTLPLAPGVGGGRGAGCAGHLSPLTRPPGGGHPAGRQGCGLFPPSAPEAGQQVAGQLGLGGRPWCSQGRPGEVSPGLRFCICDLGPEEPGGHGDHHSASRVGLTGTQCPGPRRPRHRDPQRAQSWPGELRAAPLLGGGLSLFGTGDGGRKAPSAVGQSRGASTASLAQGLVATCPALMPRPEAEKGMSAQARRSAGWWAPLPVPLSPCARQVPGAPRTGGGGQRPGARLSIAWCGDGDYRLHSWWAGLVLPALPVATPAPRCSGLSAPPHSPGIWGCTGLSGAPLKR